MMAIFQIINAMHRFTYTNGPLLIENITRTVVASVDLSLIF